MLRTYVTVLSYCSLRADTKKAMVVTSVTVIFALHLRRKMSWWSTALCAVLHLLIFAGAIETNTAITIVQRELTVREGETGMFMCEAPCTHRVYWYIGDLHSSLALPYTDSLPEITYSRSSSDCNSAGRFNDTISVVATENLNDVPIQCSASMIDCSGGDASCGAIVYSRYRFLRVESPSPSPSVSPVELSPCPSPSTVLVTTIERQTVTVRETVITTETSTSTTTVTATPTCTLPESSDARRSMLNRITISPLLILLCVSVLITLL